jgi:hypothetical protein
VAVQKKGANARSSSREITYLHEGESAFLNVDVDLFSATPLDALVAALGRKVMVHYVGRERRSYTAHFSLWFPRNADVAIKRLAQMITKLPRPGRHMWSQARKRVFNVGYQSGFRPFSFESEISSAAVTAAAGVGASITVTIYAVEQRMPKRTARRMKARH